MIRAGEKKDFNQIAELAKKIWEFSEFEETFDKEHAKIRINMSYDHELLCVLDIEGIKGFIAGVKAPSLGSPLAWVASEIGFWIERPYRRHAEALIRYVELMSMAQGVKYWYMHCIEGYQPVLASQLYQRLGYHKAETAYLKVV